MHKTHVAVYLLLTDVWKQDAKKYTVVLLIHDQEKKDEGKKKQDKLSYRPNTATLSD